MYSYGYYFANDCITYATSMTSKYSIYVANKNNELEYSFCSTKTFIIATCSGLRPPELDDEMFSGEVNEIH